jgi:hydroxymethylpyrimidine kinase/phosphomethylpyrimidine kinase
MAICQPLGSVQKARLAVINEMRHKTTFPIALTVAGSDSGGGAGVQADLKTFAALGVHGTSAVTCITAQNPDRITVVQACTGSLLVAQLAAVFAELPPRAVKTGMLYTTENIRKAARFLRRQRGLPLIVDPVMVSTSGVPLLAAEAIRALKTELLPRATLLTPNLDEAGILCGRPLREPEDLRTAARLLHQEFGCAVLVKGGHLQGTREAIDLYYDGATELLLSAPLQRGVRTHGTGCTYSAAITAYCALGRPLPEAVTQAKDYITQAIVQSRRAAGHDVLHHFWAS